MPETFRNPPELTEVENFDGDVFKVGEVVCTDYFGRKGRISKIIDDMYVKVQILPDQTVPKDLLPNNIEVLQLSRISKLPDYLTE